MMREELWVYGFCFAFWRKTYKYKLSTFSRAYGVVRKNRNDDLKLGSMPKASNFNFTIQAFKATIVI